MPWNVKWKVIVDGNDVTHKMRPSLMSIDITDKDGTASDTCNLKFDDTDGRAILPRDKASLIVYLQGVKKFEGKVDKVRSHGSRSSGRTLSVSAKGFDTKGKVKDGQHWHKDDASLDDVLNHAAKKAGLSGVKVDPEFASITRNYWSPDGSSFLAWGQALAKEHHATFKIRGDKAVFVKRGNASLPAVRGIVSKTASGNVISWDIAPKSGRAKYASAEVRYFDRKKAKVEVVEGDIGSENSDALNKIRRTAADEDQAKSILDARKTESEQDGGEGSVSLDLTPSAQAEAPFVLSGARQGVDGEYRISSVSHKASRSGGATTSLSLKQPQPN